MNPAHAVGTTNWCALTDRRNLVVGAILTGLFKAGVRGAGHHLASTGFISGDIAGTPGVGATDHNRAVGDAETNLRSLRGGLSATKAIVLLAADVFIAGDQAATAGFITGDVLTAAHMGPCNARTAEGIEGGNLGGGPAGELTLVAHVLGARELLTGARFITGHLFRATHHHTGDGEARAGFAQAHLAGGGIAGAAVSGGLVGRHIFRSGHVLAGTGLIAGHLVGAAHFIAGHLVAVAGGHKPHLGWLARHGLALAEGAEDVGTHVFSTCDRTAGAGFVAGGFGGAVGLGTGHHLTTGGFAHAHLPGGIGCSRLLGAVAVGSGRTGSTAAGGAGTAHFVLKFAEFLRKLTTGEVGIAMAGNGYSSSTAGGRC